MNAQRTHTIIALAIVAVASVGMAPADLDLSWHTVDGGGGTSAGGSFTLSGTIGQPDAGVMNGGSFELTGGFWAGIGAAPVAPSCPGDLDGNGSVDADDLGILLGDFGCVGPGCIADLDGGGSVDADDLGILLGAFGSLC